MKKIKMIIFIFSLMPALYADDAKDNKIKEIAKELRYIDSAITRSGELLQSKTIEFCKRDFLTGYPDIRCEPFLTQEAPILRAQIQSLESRRLYLTKVIQSLMPDSTSMYHFNSLGELDVRMSPFAPIPLVPAKSNECEEVNERYVICHGKKYIADPSVADRLSRDVSVPVLQIKSNESSQKNTGTPR